MCNRKGDDAFGQALMDCLLGKEDHYVIERDDGFIDPSPLGIYFAGYEDWPGIERRMPEFVRGKILDIGCGAGRHSIHLQNLGFDVTAIDRSPLAVEVAKRRGVKRAYCVSVEDLIQNAEPGPYELTPNERSATGLGPFDSVIMMGHNIGLLHGLEEGKGILSRLYELTTPGARIVGTTRDSRNTTDPDHLEYQAANLRKGRMRSQIRFRIRYRKLVGNWLDYLFVSEDEFKELAAGTGWQLEAVVKGDGGFGDSSYLAVLHRTK